MTAVRVLGWGLFFLYATWLAALQGWLARPERLGEWAPDLGLLLLFAWASRLDRARGTLAAALVVAARAGFGAAAPAALLAGTLSAYVPFSLLRSFLTVDRPLPRAALCGLGAWVLAWMLLAAQAIARAAEEPAAPVEGPRLWPLALTTALACFLLAPLCLRLPGLAPIGRRRP